MSGRFAVIISAFRLRLAKLLTKGVSDEGLIVQSGLFDAAYYAGSDEARELGIRPLEHYMRVGESKGLMPSALFDPWFYASLRPEAVGSSLILHYIRNGLPDGELPYRPVPCLATLSDRKKKTVLLIVHEASRTGAPILAWNLSQRLKLEYNLIVLLMKSGELIDSFIEASDLTIDLGMRQDAQKLVKEIISKYEICFVVANSVETKRYACEFAKSEIPVVLLVHEFSDMYTADSLAEIYERASSIVFPSEIVRESSRQDYEILNKRETVLQPQGPSIIPGRAKVADPNSKAPVVTSGRCPILPRLRPKGFETAFLVVGLGTVDYRKGVDLFVSVASAVKRLAPSLMFRFVWVGDGYHPRTGANYSAYLRFQIQQSALDEHIAILDAVSDLEPVYTETQALFLSSRIDPLPNVALDAALRGIPIVSFEKTNGMAEMLQREAETRHLVAPYQDVGAAAAIIVDLASHSTIYRDVSASLKKIAAGAFDMDSYVDKIKALGEAAANGSQPRKS